MFKITKSLLILFVIICASCNKNEPKETKTAGTFINVLGTIQDAGLPQIGCEKECCKNLFNQKKNELVVSLGIVDNTKSYLFEATPDITKQLTKLTKYNNSKNVDGVFLTHAHIGHYTGLMFLGKEAMNAGKTPVYAMPKMKSFLENNGPWNQLVKTKNIDLKLIENNNPVTLSNTLKVTPIIVPHRDEFSETVGYRIEGPKKKALFIPDIDKWEKWNTNIIDEIKKVDYAFLDATFYSAKEINNRDISEIPHPFVIESINKFKNLSKSEKSKVIFIHFNHTNPIINPNSTETKSVLDKGFRIARINDVFEL